MTAARMSSAGQRRDGAVLTCSASFGIGDSPARIYGVPGAPAAE